MFLKNLTIELFLNYEYLKNNYSPIVLDYSNGLETLLNNKLSHFFLKSMDIKYGKFPNKFPGEEWKKLDYNLKELRKGKKITLGGWSFLMNKFTQPHIESDYELWNNCLPGILNNDKKDLIRQITSEIATLRNRCAHGGTITFEDFNPLYSKIVSKINKIIDILSDSVFDSKK